MTLPYLSGMLLLLLACYAWSLQICWGKVGSQGKRSLSFE